MTDIKLIATDMDGTLLNNRKQLPPDFIPWVKAHPQLLTVIASGRQYYTLYRDFREIGDQLVFIADNGGFIFEKGKMTYCNAMSRECVELCLDQLRTMPEITPIVCGAESAYMRHGNPEAEEQAAHYYARITFVEDLYSAAAGDRIAKIALFIPGGRAEEVGKTFRCAHESLHFSVSGRDWIDISNAGIHKGAAIREIRRQHGIAREECMAFGDFMNDREMLEECGESYAMENACDGIKAIAKHRAPSNEENGVMQILQKIFP